MSQRYKYFFTYSTLAVCIRALTHWDLPEFYSTQNWIAFVILFCVFYYVFQNFIEWLEEK